MHIHPLGVKSEEDKLENGFESGEVVELVGIRPFYLNKFIERSLYGIRPSLRAGEARKRRRRFSTEDCFAIGLVWSLFESGLRSEVIKRVLRDISGSKAADANAAAKVLHQRKPQNLLIVRQRRTAGEARSSPAQTVKLLDGAAVSHLVRGITAQSACIIPVATLFQNLQEAMNAAQKGGV
jgi:hypothetical protein